MKLSRTSNLIEAATPFGATEQHNRKLDEEVLGWKQELRTIKLWNNSRNLRPEENRLPCFGFFPRYCDRRHWEIGTRKLALLMTLTTFFLVHNPRVNPFALYICIKTRLWIHKLFCELHLWRYSHWNTDLVYDLYLNKHRVNMLITRKKLDSNCWWYAIKNLYI